MAKSRKVSAFKGSVTVALPTIEDTTEIRALRKRIEECQDALNGATEVRKQAKQNLDLAYRELLEAIDDLDTPKLPFAKDVE